jgi:D-amino-acid dehydrogenase
MRVVIIGAGILGASTAYHLARAGVQVIVADRADPGRATQAGAGIVCPWLSEATDPAWYAIADAAARYYPSLVAALAEAGQPDTGYAQVGTLAVDHDQSHLKTLRNLVLSRAVPEAGTPTLLPPGEATSLFPPLDPTLSALHLPGGARVDVRRLAAALLRASGAELRPGHAMPTITAGRATGILLNNSPIEADAVILTAGAWAPELLHPHGQDLPVQSQRGQIVHLRLPNTHTDAWPVILPPGSHYMLAFEAGRIVAGATRESGVGFDHRVTAAGLHQVLTEGLRIAPGLAAAEVLETRIGFRPLSPDARPILGPMPGIQSLFIGNGLGANGITIGPYAGHLLAQLVLGHAPDLDPTPYAPNRPLHATADSALIR